MHLGSQQRTHARKYGAQSLDRVQARPRGRPVLQACWISHPPQGLQVLSLSGGKVSSGCHAGLFLFKSQAAASCYQQLSQAVQISMHTYEIVTHRVARSWPDRHWTQLVAQLLSHVQNLVALNLRYRWLINAS